ncbi:MAG: nucleoside kinase [Lachnospiraceae bacterium]|nr:nucleoside kinase [Lachnospiraceae bacterium]
MVKLTIDGRVYDYEEGTTYLAVSKDFQKDYVDDIILCTHDGRLRELSHKIYCDGEIDFITGADKVGNETYRRSAVFVFLKAFYDVVGSGKACDVFVDFSVSKGYYIRARGDFSLDAELIDKVERRMHSLCDLNLPICKRTVDVEDAIKLFGSLGMHDKERLFKYRMSSKINLYELDGYYDYFYGYMVPSTGYVKYFKLYQYGEGLVLQMPTKNSPRKLEEFKPQNKVTAKLIESSKWSAALNVSCVADLNEKIVNRTINDIMLIQETQQNQELANIVKAIKDRGNVKFIMIAGPSSSGKTSFSHRLSIQLRAQGYKPHPIGVDDYFINREDCPRDENGDYNFEDIDSIDVKAFNRDMNMLLNGEQIEMPRYNFKTGFREYRGEFLKLNEDDILIIEGIHCLNPALYPNLPAENMFKVYISALTQLNVDEHNRVSTTDGRLLRRMARDAARRGISATETIARWESVRRGEEKNIFPFQETADVVFNSAMCYELPVLKTYVEPLLFSVPRNSKEYIEAKRLLKFLSYFLAIPADQVPNDSILREFVGGSVFPV